MALLEVETVPLQPAYPDFPENGERYANVLCEGPSILLALRGDLLPGPTVAVNHALGLSWKLPVDVWATSDDPNHLWGWSHPHLPPAAKLFSTENNCLLWETLLGTEELNERLYGWQPTYMEHLETPEQKAPVLPTVMPVLAWLAHVGVEEVRLFGCDMEGQNSPLSAEPYSDEEDIGWEWRWEHERKLLSLAIKKYRERGKRLSRWVKARRSSRNSLSSWSKMQRPAR